MEIKSLVDPEGGLVNRRIFADREIYELEREHLFARVGSISATKARCPVPATSSPPTWEKTRSSCAEI